MTEQQPIPQDINKWIEDEAQKFITTVRISSSSVDNIRDINIRKGFRKCAQLLLPQLQGQQSQIEELKKNHDATLKLAASNYREMLSAKVESRTNQQAAELESLKRENEAWVEVSNNKQMEIEFLKSELSKLKEIPHDIEEFIKQVIYTAQADFANWLETQTRIVYEDKITLYQYIDSEGLGNYILDDIFIVYAEKLETDFVSQIYTKLKAKHDEEMKDLRWQLETNISLMEDFEKSAKQIISEKDKEIKRLKEEIKELGNQL